MPTPQVPAPDGSGALDDHGVHGEPRWPGYEVEVLGQRQLQRADLLCCVSSWRP